MRGASAEPLDGARESLPVPIERAPDAARERLAGAVEPAEQLSQLRHDELSRGRRGRGADVRREVAERRVLLVPDGGDHGDGALGDRPDDAFVAEGEEILEAAAAAGEDDRRRRPGCSQRAPIAATISAAARGPCTYVSATSTVAGGKRELDRRHDVALRGRVVPGHDADAPRQVRQRPLARVGEEALGGEGRLQALERGEVGADAEALDRERAELELAALLVELRPAEDVHALAVREVEPQRVEPPARHRHADARAVGRILEREEDASPSARAGGAR